MSRGRTMENLSLDDSGWWRLGARTRKGVLVAHIASAGAWIGIDVVMGVFCLHRPARLERGHEGAVLPGAGAVRLLAADNDRPPLPVERRRPGPRHQVGPGSVLVGGDETRAERRARRAGAGRVAAGGDGEGRAGQEVRGGESRLAGGGRPDLPTDGLPDPPAGGVRAGGNDPKDGVRLRGVFADRLPAGPSGLEGLPGGGAAARMARRLRDASRGQAGEPWE